MSTGLGFARCHRREARVPQRQTPFVGERCGVQGSQVAFDLVHEIVGGDRVSASSARGARRCGHR